MPNPKTVTVQPVEGVFLDGIPAQETTTDTATAAAWVASGAFTYSAPGGAASPDPGPEAPQAPAATMDEEK